MAAKKLDIKHIEPKNRYLNVRVSKQMMSQIKKEAKNHECSMSKFVVAVLDQWLKN